MAVAILTGDCAVAEMKTARRRRSFPLDAVALRYIERNSLRVNLCRRAEKWAWGIAKLWLPGAQNTLVVRDGSLGASPGWIT